MIEPHPDFRKISFKINEANPDKLGLDIMCKRTEDEEDAPILYLSSAQVNILSLSIFSRNRSREYRQSEYDFHG